MALVGIQKCLVLLHDYLGQNTKKQWLHTHDYTQPPTHLHTHTHYLLENEFTPLSSCLLEHSHVNITLSHPLIQLCVFVFSIQIRTKTIKNWDVRFKILCNLLFRLLKDIGNFLSFQKNILVLSHKVPVLYRTPHQSNFQFYIFLTPAGGASPVVPFPEVLASTQYHIT